MGQTNTLEIEEFVDEGAYLGDGDQQVLLPKSKVPKGSKLGDRLRVFIYRDSDDYPVATTDEPFAEVGDFACLAVVDIADHGAFVDWGLEKDLFIPFKEQSKRLHFDDQQVFYVRIHKATERVIGSSCLNRYFEYDISGYQLNQEVKLLVYGFNEQGAHVVVDNRYRGMIYHNEVYKKVLVGDAMTGWVSGLREDNRLDISLQRQGHAGTIDAKEVILHALNESDGFLPLHDKSDPKAIVKRLGMSKKVFKKAIGVLYRAKVIKISSLGIQKLAGE